MISGGSRIFPRGVRQLPKSLLFFKFLPKTAWKWKNLDPQGGGARPWRPPLDPPMMIILLTSKAEWFWRTMRKADEQLYCISDCWVHWIINTRFSIENTFCIWHVWLFGVVFLATSSFNFVLMGSLCLLCEIFSQKSKSAQTGHRIDCPLFTSIYNTRTCIFTSFPLYRFMRRDYVGTEASFWVTLRECNIPVNCQKQTIDTVCIVLISKSNMGR